MNKIKIKYQFKNNKKNAKYTDNKVYLNNKCYGSNKYDINKFKNIINVKCNKNYIYVKNNIINSNYKHNIIDTAKQIYYSEYLYSAILIESSILNIKDMIRSKLGIYLV